MSPPIPFKRDRGPQRPVSNSCTAPTTSCDDGIISSSSNPGFESRDVPRYTEETSTISSDSRVDIGKLYGHNSEDGDSTSPITSSSSSCRGESDVPVTLQQQLGGYEWELSEETESYDVVGKTSCRFSSAGRKEEKETTQQERQKVPGLNKWSNANRSPSAALASFANQAKRRTTGTKPSASRINEAVDRLLPLYPKTKPPAGFRSRKGYGDLPFDEDIVRARVLWSIENEIPKDSKPGVPYSVLGADNKDIVLEHPEFIADLVIDRLKILSTTDCSLLTPVELVQIGACDPVRVFVKGEPHSQNKVNQERWRLIFAVSIVDQLIERLLCSTQNKAEIKNWLKCPSAPGINLTSDETLAELYELVKTLKGTGDLAEADVTGWDWSVKEWELILEADMRARLGNFPEATARLLRNRQYCVSRSVYAMPDGRLLVLHGNGVQLSGCYNTSSTNSRLRVLIAFLIGAQWAYAMGDDCLEDPVEGAMEKYLALGHALKMYGVRSDGEFEFCSSLHTPLGAWPIDGTKTLYRLIEQKQITPGLIAQFQLEMRNSPRLEEFLACVRRVSMAGGQSPQKESLHA